MLISLLAALDWPSIVWWSDVIVKVAIGLGAVIFVHELGHFLVAKACGVKVEKFMIGFDIGGYKLSRRWGETEYGVGILPLGGYVKMLGQDDDPAHIAEQMKKSQVDASSSDAVPITGPSGETYYVDRRSYLAKSVPQRMAIISAGVTMNIIFAFIFAVIAYGMGVPYVPSIVSGTVPGSPAWQAGLEPGDEIVQIGGRQNPTFLQLQGSVTLGDLEHGIPVLVRRAADDEVVPLTLKPTQVAGRLATVGIEGPRTLELLEGLPTIAGSAAAKAKLVAPTPDDTVGEARLQGGDEIVRVGDVAVKSYREFAFELCRNWDKPLMLTVKRRAKKPAPSAERGKAEQADATQELTFEVQPEPQRQFGLVMKMGPITAVRPGSPAEAAGLKRGDVIESVDGRAIGAGAAAESWNADTLSGYLRRAARDGREVEFVVQRPEKGEAGGGWASVQIRVSPVLPTTVTSVFPARPMGTPMAADEIGIAYRVENEVASVVADTPAAGQLQPGERLLAAEISYPADADEAPLDTSLVELGDEQLNWPTLVDAMQFAPPGTKVTFTIQRGKDAKPRDVTLAPVPMAGAYVNARGFVFEPVMRTRIAQTFAQQVSYGFDETVDALTMVFRFLQKLGTQVPINMLGGPGTIAVAAGGAASQGLSTLLIFLTMLSANLAVINFLPIPLLDGGHMVFLAYEGIRGRPASEKLVLALHMAGFVFIIGLMVFVIGLDIQRWILT